MTEEQLIQIGVVIAQIGVQGIIAAHKASGVPITPESVAALAPDLTPLSAPDA